MQHIDGLLAGLDAVRKRLDEQRPFTPEQEASLRKWFLPRFLYCSSALGREDPVTGRQTMLYLESHTVAGGHHVDEFLAIDRHVTALEAVEKRAAEDGQLDSAFVRQLHAILLEGSRNPIEGETPGAWKEQETPLTRRRGHEVEFAPPARVAELMERLFEEVSKQRARGDHPLRVVAYLYFHLYLIQPFFTHNGEVSRLLVTTLLLQEGYPGLIVPPDAVRDFLDALVSVHRTVPERDREFLSSRYDPSFLIEFFSACLIRSGERMIDIASGKRLNTMTFSRAALNAQEGQMSQFLKKRGLSWRVRAGHEVKDISGRVKELLQPLEVHGPLFSIEYLRGETIPSHSISPSLRSLLPSGEAGVVGQFQLSITPNPLAAGIEFPDPEQIMVGVACTQVGLHLIFMIATDTSVKPTVRSGPLRSQEWPDALLEKVVVKAVDKRRTTFEYELGLRNTSRSQRFKLKKIREEGLAALAADDAADQAALKDKEPSGPKKREKHMEGLRPTEPPISF